MDQRKMTTSVDDSNDGTLDVLRKLPNPILHIIMEKLMDCQKSGRVVHVQHTGYLNKTMNRVSKKFKMLCDTMPYLCFDDYNGDFPNMGRAVNHVLFRPDAPKYIHSLHVNWSAEKTDEEWEDHLITWCEHVVECKIKLLELRITIGFEEEPLEFPSCIFTCKSLEALKLGFTVTRAIFPSGPVQLRKLKILHLFCFGDEWRSSPPLKKLISGCPILEELEIRGCTLKDIDVSSNTLQRLSIEASNPVGSLINISCPSLRVFSFHRNDIGKDYYPNPNVGVKPKVLLGSVSNLVEATFQINNGCMHRGHARDEAESVKFITSKNKNVSENSELPLFCNLRKLKLDGRHIEMSFATVTRFIQQSPNLEVLTLSKVDFVPLEVIIVPKRCYECPHFKLKVKFTCGKENGKIIKLMDEFVGSKCKCPMDYPSSS